MWFYSSKSNSKEYNKKIEISFSKSESDFSAGIKNMLAVVWVRYHDGTSDIDIGSYIQFNNSIYFRYQIDEMSQKMTMK